MQTLAMTYAQEFNYTNKHISLYKNNEITVAFYKDKNIIRREGSNKNGVWKIIEKK